MERKITVLPPEIVSKIAAGEVIERPASVVKELLENSLDAQATKVTIQLEAAGRKLIRVRDNGSGISGEDLTQIFHRHATSKISHIDDLYAVSSLGFRGEALYSIAAVSDVTVRSATSGAGHGWEIHYRGGDSLSPRKPAAVTQGTEIEVKELFFNTPARRKFLRSDTAELNQIMNIVTPYTLLMHQVDFKLTHGGRTLTDLKSGDERLSRVARSLRLEEKDLLSVNHEFAEEKLSFSLILGNANIQRGRRDQQYLFVNGRPVVNRSLSYHMNEAYKCLFPEGVCPVFCVFINLPAQEVDVNVHPAKREVKIRNESSLSQRLRYACERALMTYSSARQAKERIFTLNETAGSTPGENKPVFANHVPGGKTLSAGEHRVLFEDRAAYSVTPPVRPLTNTLKDARYIGGYKNKYLLFDAGESLVVIDQHAAHERITFEKLSQQIKKGKCEIDNLLSPLLLKVSAQEMLIWEEIKEELEKMGFSTTTWDKETLALHAYPRLIRKPETAVRNLLSGEETEVTDLEALTRRACRASVMTGDSLHKEEALSLRKELLNCADPFTCPHGRPTVIEINETQLSRQFLR
ncbi:MAG: DNA mismatch repair endonuclease MutL [Candidatus Omnitrophica bacterium]|nr:DNA mismatch repair endonuclease MutL [Candidatus Omnitrophota bacterium]